MANVTKVTAEKKAQFLENLAETASVTRAAELSGISRREWYRTRDEDEEFAAGWSDAWEKGVKALEDEVIRRAYHGVDKPVFQGGKLVGTVREYSDTLLMFKLKALRPDKYRERITNEHSGPDGGPIVTVYVPANNRD